MITLKEHNIKPYEELCRMLEEQDKVAYVSATGTGKSYVIGKYIEDHNLIDDTVILVPYLPIKRSWKKLLPQIKVYTYQGLHMDRSIIAGCRLLVCDEMHHMGAKEWGNACENLFSGFGGKIIGTTATPVRFLDNQRNISDEFFGGNQVSGLTLPEAVSQGVLPSFEYITALYDLPKRLKKRKTDKPYTENLYAQLDMMSSKYSFQEILKKHLQGEENIKVAVFVNHIFEIGNVETMCKAVFPEAHHFVAHSKMQRHQVELTIKDFESTAGICFLYTVNILNEGVHIDGVDSVVMFRKTMSPIIYLQQIGRALSSNNADKRIKVFDFVANHCNLNAYMKSGCSVIGWIKNSITDPDRQIVISDYAIEELELLEKLNASIIMVWTKQEDEIIAEHYGNEDGLDKIAELLPWRTRIAIMNRAGILGCTTDKRHDYGDEFYNDIRRYFPEEGGTEILLKMYPGCKKSSLSTIASKLGVRKKSTPPNWTEKEDGILKAHPDATMSEWRELLPNRTPRAINRRRGILGLVVPRERHIWPDNTDEIMMKHRHLTANELKKAFFPDISKEAIQVKRVKIGAEFQKDIDL